MRKRLRDMPRTSAMVLVRLLAFALALIASAATVGAQDEMMRRRGEHMDRGHRGGIGVDNAIELGIGVGGLIQQNAPSTTEDPDKKKVKRTRKDNARDEKRAKDKELSKENLSEIKFVGKPERVVHDPKHRDGKLGDLRDHKQVVIQKDGVYFKRHYYYTRSGKRLTWYWYDDPVPDKDPVIATLKDIPACDGDSDDCDDQPLTRPPENIEDTPHAPPTPATPPNRTTILERSHVCLENTGIERDKKEINCGHIDGKISVRTGITPNIPRGQLSDEEYRIQLDLHRNGIQIGFEQTLASGTFCRDCFWYQFFWLEINVFKDNHMSKYDREIDFAAGHGPTNPNPLGFDKITPTTDKTNPTDGTKIINWVVDGSKTSPKYPSQKCDDCGTVMLDRPGAIFDIESFPLVLGVPRFGASTADKVVSKMHFETYLVCDHKICGMVEWTSTWTWEKGNTGISGPDYTDIKINPEARDNFNPGQNNALTAQHLTSPLQ